MTIPRDRTRFGLVSDDDLEAAAEYVASRAERGGACSLEVIRSRPDGLRQEAVAELLDETRQAVSIVERRALAKVGAELRRLGWTLP